MTKKWYLSKMLWLNVITLLLVVIPAAQTFLLDTFAITVPALATVVATLNTILRLFFTNTNLTT
jgi:hypothetical protein